MSWKRPLQTYRGPCNSIRRSRNRYKELTRGSQWRRDSWFRTYSCRIKRWKTRSESSPVSRTSMLNFHMTSKLWRSSFPTQRQRGTRSKPTRRSWSRGSSATVRLWSTWWIAGLSIDSWLTMSILSVPTRSRPRCSIRWVKFWASRWTKSRCWAWSRKPRWMSSKRALRTVW